MVKHTRKLVNATQVTRRLEADGSWTVMSVQKAKIEADPRDYPKERNMSISVRHTPTGYVVFDAESKTEKSLIADDPKYRPNYIKQLSGRKSQKSRGIRY